jgi:hypothetical protein
VNTRRKVGLAVAAVASLAAAHPPKAAGHSNCPKGPKDYSFTIESVRSTGYHLNSDGSYVFSFEVRLGFKESVFVLVSYDGLGRTSSKSLNKASPEPYKFEINSRSSHFPSPPNNLVYFSFLSSCLENGHAQLTLVKTSSENSDDSSCPDYEVLDLRGSGAPKGEVSQPGEAFYKEFKLKHPNQRGALVEIAYRAAGGVMRLTGAALAMPSGYHRSVVAGKSSLSRKIKDLSKRCPDTATYLVGYSQGAQVAGDVYQAGGWRYVKGVALFGDPYFNNRDKPADRGNFEPGLSGALGTRPLFGGLEEGYVLSYCHKHDPVCQGPLEYYTLARYGFKPHENYGVKGEPEEAADYFSQH